MEPAREPRYDAIYKWLIRYTIRLFASGTARACWRLEGRRITMSKRQLARFLLTMLIALALAACQGGGGEGEEDDDEGEDDGYRPAIAVIYTAS